VLTKEEVIQVLSKTTHPEIDYSLVDLGMIKDVSIEEDKMAVTVNLPFAGIPIRDLLVQIVTEAVANEDEAAQVEVQFATMSEEERVDFMRKARERWKS